MSTPFEQILAQLMSEQNPQSSAGVPASADFGANGVAANTGKPLPPEDSIVSPNPTQPNPPDQRMEGYRRLLTNFTYSLGSGLEAANANPRGAGQRTQAGMGAILQVPQKLEAARQAYALQQTKQIQELAAAKASEANANKANANLSLLPIQIQQALANVAKTQTDTGLAPFKAGAQVTTANAAASNAATNAAKLEFQKTQKTAEELKQAQFKYLTTQQTDEGPKALFSPPNWNGDPSQLVEKTLGGPADKLQSIPIEDPNSPGRGILANHNPVTGEFTINGQVIKDARPFNKPVNDSSKYQLIKTVDENGDSVQTFVPKTPGVTYSSDMTAQEKNRKSQADIIQVEADRIIKMIDANPGAAGPIAGRIARGETVIGNVDPQVKALGTALGSFEALQPILHGFRGGSQTVDHFHSVIGDQSLNPEALKASLLQIKRLAGDIKTGVAVDLYPPVSGAQAATTKIQTAPKPVPPKAGYTVMSDPNGKPHYVLDAEVGNAPSGWSKIK